MRHAKVKRRDSMAELAREGKVVRAELAVIKRLEAAGHTYHCARRLVWGDGECECGRVCDVKS